MRLVLLRHGESRWNRQNRFTGWVDIGLTRKGEQQAKNAGRQLKRHGLVLDTAFTSFLRRAAVTLRLALRELGQSVPVRRSWRLNERFYGALQGMDKAEMAERFGERQVLLWRRGYSVRPPALKKTSPMYPGNLSKYAKVPKKDLPLAESLRDTVKRVLPYWKQEIAPELRQGNNVIIAAHGNSLRALVKILDRLTAGEILHLNIPVGIPLVYELDSRLRPARHYYLGDPHEIKKAISAVKEQGRAR